MKEKNAEVRSTFKSVDEMMEHAEDLYGEDAYKFDYKRPRGEYSQTIDNLSWDDVAKCVEIFDNIFGSDVDVKLFYDGREDREIVEDEYGEGTWEKVVKPLEKNKYDTIAASIKSDGAKSIYKIGNKVITEDRIEDYLKALILFQMTRDGDGYVFYQKKDGTKLQLDTLSRTDAIEKRKKERAERAENERLEKEYKEISARAVGEIVEADWSECYKLPMNAPDKIGREIDFKSISDEEFARCEQLFDKLFEPVYKYIKDAGYDQPRERTLRYLMGETTIKNVGDEDYEYINTVVGNLCEDQLGRYGDNDKKREYYELERYAKAYLIHNMLDPKKEINIARFKKEVGKYKTGSFMRGDETTLLKKDLPQADKEAGEEKKRLQEEEEKKRQQEAEEKRRQEEAEKKKRKEEEEKKRREAEEAEKKRKEEEENKKQQEQNENKIEEAQPMEFEEGETAEPMEFEEGETADIIEGEEEEEELQPVDLATLNSLKDDIPALADKLIQGQRYALAHPEYDQNLITGFMKSFKGERDALRKEIDRRSVLALAGRARYIDKNYSSADIIKKHPELNGMQYVPRYMMMIQEKIANKVCNSDEYAATNALRNTYVKGVTLARDLNRVSDQLKLEEKNNTFTSTDWNYFVSGYIMTFKVGYKSDFNVEVEENGDFKLTFKEGITIDDFVGQRLDSSIDTYKSFKTSMDKISEKAKKFADQIEEMSKTGGEIGKFIADKFRDISKVNGDCQKGEIEDAIRNIYNNKDVVKDFIAEEKKKYKNLSGDKLKELKKQVGDGNYLYGTLTNSALEWANTLKLTGISLAKLPATNIRYDIQEISSDIVINKDYDIVVSRLDSYNKRQEEKQQEEEQLAEEQRQKEEEQQRLEREEKRKKEEEERNRRKEEAEKKRKEAEEKERLAEEQRQKKAEKKHLREEKRKKKEAEDKQSKENAAYMKKAQAIFKEIAEMDKSELFDLGINKGYNLDEEIRGYFSLEKKEMEHYVQVFDKLFKPLYDYAHEVDPTQKTFWEDGFVHGFTDENPMGKKKEPFNVYDHLKKVIEHPKMKDEIYNLTKVYVLHALCQKNCKLNCTLPVNTVNKDGNVNIENKNGFILNYGPHTKYEAKLAEEKRKEEEKRLEYERRKAKEREEERARELELERRKKEEEEKKAEIAKTAGAKHAAMQNLSKEKTGKAWDLDFNVITLESRNKTYKPEQLSAEQVENCRNVFDEIFGKDMNLKCIHEESEGTAWAADIYTEVLSSNEDDVKFYNRPGQFTLLGKPVDADTISDYVKARTILDLTCNGQNLYFVLGDQITKLHLEKSQRRLDNEKQVEEEVNKEKERIEKLKIDSENAANDAIKKINGIDRSAIFDLPINSEKNRDKDFDINTISEEELKLYEETFDQIFEPVVTQIKDVNKFAKKREDDLSILFREITDSKLEKNGSSSLIWSTVDKQCKNSIKGFGSLKWDDQEARRDKYIKAYILKRMAEKDGGIKFDIPYKHAVAFAEKLNAVLKLNATLSPATEEQIKQYDDAKKAREEEERKRREEAEKKRLADEAEAKRKRDEEHAREKQQKERQRQERIKALFAGGIKTMDASAAFDLPENKDKNIDLSDFAKISDDLVKKSEEVYDKLFPEKALELKHLYFKDEKGKEVNFFEAVRGKIKHFYNKEGGARYNSAGVFIRIATAYTKSILLHLMSLGKPTGIYYKEKENEIYDLPAFTVPKGYKAVDSEDLSLDKFLTVIGTKNTVAQKDAAVKKDDEDNRINDNKINDNIINTNTNDKGLININDKEDGLISGKGKIILEANIADDVKELGKEKATEIVIAQDIIWKQRAYIKNSLNDIKAVIDQDGRKNANLSLEDDGHGDYSAMLEKLNDVMSIIDNDKELNEEGFAKSHKEVLKAIKSLMDAAAKYKKSHEPGFLKKMFFGNGGFKHSYGKVRYDQAKLLSDKASELYQGYFNQAVKLSPDLESSCADSMSYARKCADEYELRNIESTPIDEYSEIIRAELDFRTKLYIADTNTRPALNYYNMNGDYSKLFGSAKKKDGMKKGMEAACYAAAKELDKFADPNLTAEKAKEIVDSFDPQAFKALISMHKRNLAFNEAIANAEGGRNAFTRYDEYLEKNPLVIPEVKKKGKISHIIKTDDAENIDDQNDDLDIKEIKTDTEDVNKVAPLKNEYNAYLYANRGEVEAEIINCVEDDGDIDRVIEIASDYIVHDVLASGHADDILLEITENGNEEEIMQEMKECVGPALKLKMPIEGDYVGDGLSYANDLFSSGELDEYIAKEFRKKHKAKKPDKKKKFDAKKHNKANDMVDMVIKRKEELTKNYSKDNDRGGKEQNTDNKYKQWALQARKQLEQYAEDEEKELNYSTKNKNKLIGN